MNKLATFLLCLFTKKVLTKIQTHDLQVSFAIFLFLLKMFLSIPSSVFVSCRGFATSF